MFGLGQTELIIFLVIVLIIFGPKNLPKLARSMGQAIRDFRTGIKGVEREMADEDEESPVETSAKIEGKSGGTEASIGEKKAHGQG
jgi:sec-independent protein translocase protein TatA